MGKNRKFIRVDNYCPDSPGKLTFRSESDAWSFIKSRTDVLKLHPYRCRICQRFHVTSQGHPSPTQEEE